MLLLFLCTTLIAHLVEAAKNVTLSELRIPTQVAMAGTFWQVHLGDFFPDTSYADLDVSEFLPHPDTPHRKLPEWLHLSEDLSLSGLVPNETLETHHDLDIRHRWRDQDGREHLTLVASFALLVQKHCWECNIVHKLTGTEGKRVSLLTTLLIAGAYGVLTCIGGAFFAWFMAARRLQKLSEDSERVRQREAELAYLDAQGRIGRHKPRDRDSDYSDGDDDESSDDDGDIERHGLLRRQRRRRRRRR
ncbi:MAG: hypothetical protein MHM6MM_002774 [Cercozoa sp. M6MM]